MTTRSQGRVGSGARPFQEEGTASAKTVRQEEAWRRPFLPRNLASEGPGFPAAQHGPVHPLPRALCSGPLTQIQKKFPVPQYGQPYHTLFNISPDSPPSHKPSGFFQDPGKEAVFTSSGPFPSSLTFSQTPGHTDLSHQRVSGQRFHKPPHSTIHLII